MQCPSCHGFVDEGGEFCPTCLIAVPTGAAPATATRSPAALPEPVEPAPFVERFPDQQPCEAHPDFPIAGTCERCGRFVCVRCAPELATRDTARCSACDARETADAPQGIGGWLVLVALGVALSPIGTAWLAAKVLSANLGHPMTGRSIIIVTIYVIALVIAAYQVAVAVVFFSRKRLAVPMLIVSYGLMVAFCVARLFAELSVGSDALTQRNVESLVRQCIGAAIWVPYLLSSRRVKATFVR